MRLLIKAENLATRYAEVPVRFGSGFRFCTVFTLRMHDLFAHPKGTVVSVSVRLW